MRYVTILLTSAALGAGVTPVFAQQVRQTGSTEARDVATAPATDTRGAQDPENAAAQTSASAPDTDIVVTAQRRSERVTDVPISITLANQAQLERQQVNSVSDLARIAPALEINNAQGQNVGGGGIIRGVGTSTFSAGTQASVGVVVDQVSQGTANISDLFDVARIEVLKGPQGTLFGLTTSAGVINITTNAPDPTRTTLRMRTELSDSGTAGSEYGQQILQAVANLPLSSNAAIRISALENLRQGPQRNTLRDGLNKINRQALRGRLLWEPTDALTINVIGDYSWQESTGYDFFTFTTDSVGTGAAAGKPALAALLTSCGVTIGEGNKEYCTNLGIRQKQKNYGASLQLDYDFGPVTLTSISSYRGNEFNQNLGSIYRADPLATVPAVIISQASIVKTDLYTQEARLSSPSSNRLEYTLGAFYSHETTETQPTSTFNRQGTRILDSARGLLTSKSESYAGFGQLTLHATDALRLLAGARYTHSELSFLQRDVKTTNTNGADQSVNNFSYRAGAQYDISAKTMVYATVNRGFKSGQITVPSNITTAPFAIRPEIPQAYDLGLKSTLFDGWVMDLNAFHQKVKDYQGQQCTINSTTGAFNCQQINIDYILARGAEINLFGRVSEALTLNTGFLYAKTTYAPGVKGKDGANLGGAQVANAPRYKFTASGEYTTPVSNDMNAFFGADAVWKSRVRYQQSALTTETFRPHWIVGGRIGVRDASERFSLSVFARNLFNVHEPAVLQQPLANAYSSAVGAIYSPQAYRQIGLSLDGKF